MFKGLLFGLTIFQSAFLLFMVQPLISKYILPWFGGSSSVWTTAMLFFQVVLCAGYLLADLMIRYVPIRRQMWFYAGLFALALFSLPIIPADSWKPTGLETPIWRVLGLLALAVGLPYLILSTTGPIIQAWYARAADKSTVYRLYALSNAGSLLALLVYPFVVEPLFDLHRQAILWTSAFGLYMIFMLACSYVVRNSAESLTEDSLSTQDDNSELGGDAPPRWFQYAGWIFFPMVASLLFLATTNHVCQDVASLPLLWIIPLALYLITLIICFDRPLWYRPILMGTAAIVLAAWAINPDKFLWWSKEERNVHFTIEFLVSFGALFFGCMVCHGEVAKLRPSPKYLTLYYLMLSAGGALGGLFVSLVAPVIFEKYFEWGVSLELVIVASVIALTRIFVLILKGYPKYRIWVAVPIIVEIALVGGSFYWIFQKGLVFDRRSVVATGRNFYGALRVMEYYPNDPERHMRMFVHGNIRHGQQYLKPEKQRTPASYYPPESGAPKAIEQFASSSAHVGVVGLGIGTLAVYGKPGDRYTFYEINPMVEQYARKYFTYLEQCQAEVEIVIGDARLSMERQSPQAFDVIVVDAFSGDAIPVHLITKEAMDVYARHLKPDGILVFHISNSYLDLYPVTLKLAEYAGLDSRLIITQGNDEDTVYRTDYVVLTNRTDFLRQNPNHPPDRKVNDRVPLWTDHYSNLFQILKTPW